MLTVLTVQIGEIKLNTAGPNVDVTNVGLAM